MMISMAYVVEAGRINYVFLFLNFKLLIKNYSRVKLFKLIGML